MYKEKSKHGKSRILIGCAIGLAVIAVSVALLDRFLPNTQILHAAENRPMPEFTQQSEREWFNSAPLQSSDLRGKVVMIDFWTFECWNCYRSFPWLKGVEAKFANKPFTVIGIHTPEFSHEKIHANIKKKIAEFGLEHPVMVDNDRAYWRKMRNRYWPAFYLIDKKGNIRSVFVGETHTGQPRARKIEAQIAKLLKESA